MRQGSACVGHPVDVASGAVYSTHRDIVIAGSIDLVWARSYSTGSLANQVSPLGLGWTSLYHYTLTRNTDGYRFGVEGDLVHFPLPAGEHLADRQTLRSLPTFQELTRRGDRLVLTQWDVDSGDISELVFTPRPLDVPAPLLRIEKITGQALDLLRDSAGRLVEVRQLVEGRALMLVYDTSGLITAVALRYPDQTQRRLVSYEYDEGRRLRSAIDAAGNADRYEYDATGRMTREELRDRGVFFFTYDKQGRCIRTAGLDGFDKKTLRYLDAARFTEVTDSLGHVRRYQLNALGQVVAEFDPLGAKRETEYDVHGRISARREPNGAVTKYEYDEFGNRNVIVNPIGYEERLTYNERHLPVVLVDRGGHTWRRVYDERNRLVEGVNPLGGRWRYEFNAIGNLVRVTDPSGAMLHQSFSERGQLATRTDWEGHLTAYDFDDHGRLTQRTDPLGRRTRISYDALGNTLEAILADGSRIVCEYDSGGNKTLVTDGAGRTTRFRWGTCQRLLERVDPAGHSVIYEWGTEPHRLERVRNEVGEVHMFDYDAAGRVRREIMWDGTDRRYERDANGYCVAVVKGDGDRIAYDLDLLGQVRRQVLTDGGSLEFDYDPFGRLVLAANADATVRFERDPLGQVLKETSRDFVVTSTYDAAGNRVSWETSLGLQVECRYDGNGDMQTLLANQLHAMVFHWNQAREETARDLPRGQRYEQRYDAAGRLASQEVLAVAQVNRGGETRARTQRLVGRRYTFDAGSTLRELDDYARGKCVYSYDECERLLRTTVNGEEKEQFDYDAAGNIVRRAAAGSAPDSLQYARGSRLQRRGATEYEHDAAGRLVAMRNGAGEAPGWDFRWDSLDQLRSVRDPNGTEWRYKYDALGRRLTTESSGEERHYLWDSATLVHNFVGRQNPETWVYSPSSLQPLFRMRGDLTWSVLTDHLARPLELVSLGGEVEWSASQTAWGMSEADSAEGGEADCPLRFPGQWYDPESGLHYNRFRYYDPRTGRFLSPDAMGLRGGLHQYLYAPNPVNWVDPFGLNGCPRDEFPDDPHELTGMLGVQPVVTLTNDGTTRMVWQPNPYTRIRYESHPGNPALPPTHPTFAPRHHGPHYHVEVRANPAVSWGNKNNVTKVEPPGYTPGMGTGFLPGEKFP
jgi:RHS repeat-associated protein